MKTMNSSLRALIVAAACSAGMASAQNLPYNLTFKTIEYDPSYQVNGTFTDGDTLPGGQIEDYASGLMAITAYDTGGDQNDTFMFNAFCVEPTDPFDGALLYQGTTLSGLNNYVKVQKLIGGYLQNVATITDLELQGREAAAVQWAIWEVVADTSGLNSVSEESGNVYVIPGGTYSLGDPDRHDDTDALVITRANQYLAAMNSYSPANLIYLTSVGDQDVVTWNIPEPGTAGLLALSVLGFLRRRR